MIVLLILMAMVMASPALAQDVVSPQCRELMRQFEQAERNVSDPSIDEMIALQGARVSGNLLLDAGCMNEAHAAKIGSMIDDRPDAENKLVADMARRKK
jgi:hypothetical protein